MSTRETIQAVKAALSAARVSTYEAAAGSTGDADPAALALYAWNAQVSAALLVPLHICEIVIRNAVSDAVEAVHGPRWPWSPGFEQSLPSPRVGYSTRRDLQAARRTFTTPGKVIAELKFVFWQRMFTDRFDGQIWNANLSRVLPGFDPTKTVKERRQQVFRDLESVRTLRNRIAHHEPIFTRNLIGDLEQIARLIAFRSELTADWMMDNQQALSLIKLRP